jgi:hypothetical protein
MPLSEPSRSQYSCQLRVEDQQRVLASVGDPANVRSPPVAAQRQALPPSTPSTGLVGSVSTIASQKRKRDTPQDIIELSDSDSEEGPAKKRTASTSNTQPTATSARNRPFASSSPAQGSSAGGPRPNALTALNALTTVAAAALEQEPEDQGPEERGVYSSRVVCDFF